MTKMTKAQRAQIIKHLRSEMSKTTLTRFVFATNGFVTAIADPMPNTNKQGRIFLGLDTEILALSNYALRNLDND